MYSTAKTIAIALAIHKAKAIAIVLAIHIAKAIDTLLYGIS